MYINWIFIDSMLIVKLCDIFKNKNIKLINKRIIV